MKYYMHINYIEKVFDIPEICSRCADSGFDGIELRGEDRSGKMALEDYLPFAYDAAKSNNLDLVYGPRTLAISESEEQRRQSLDDLITVINFAGSKGLKILNCFGGPLFKDDKPSALHEQNGSGAAGEEHFQRTAVFFKEAGDKAAEHNINLCMEMHNGYIHDLAKPTAKLLEMIDKPNVKANFDMGNIVLNNNALPIDECIKTIAPYIGYIHLKNMIYFQVGDKKVYRGCALDDGDINHYDLIRRLVEAGYKGPWTIENTMKGDKRPLITRDLTYLKSIIEDVS